MHFYRTSRNAFRMPQPARPDLPAAAAAGTGVDARSRRDREPTPLACILQRSQYSLPSGFRSRNRYSMRYRRIVT